MEKQIHLMSGMRIRGASLTVVGFFPLIRTVVVQHRVTHTVIWQDTGRQEGTTKSQEHRHGSPCSSQPVTGHKRRLMRHYGTAESSKEPLL